MNKDEQENAGKGEDVEGRMRRKDFHSHPRGAKTFRRGRAIAFLERLEQKRATLKKQLETPELQSINTVLVGELKAVEGIIDEFVLLFELVEFKEALNDNSKQKKENKNG